MEDWKIYALAFFPEMRTDLLDDDFSYYHVFFELHRTLPARYRSPDSHEQLHQWFAYARWCLFHEDEDIRNGAMVAFYEHLLISGRIGTMPFCWVYEDEEVKC